MAAPVLLPSPRVVVTHHDQKGASVFASDSEMAGFFPFGPAGSSFRNFHASTSVPVSNTATPPELQNTIPRCPPGGILFCTTDIAPNFTVPMHRTLSLDYCVVVQGEIVLTLDNGEEKVIKAGDMIVQKGVNHQWTNRQDTPCRIAVVAVAAEKVQLEDGTVLEELAPKLPNRGNA